MELVATGMGVIKVEPTLPRTAPAAPAPAVAAALPPVGTVVAVEAVRDAATGHLLLLFAGRRWALKPGGAVADVQAGARLTARVVRNEPDLELAVLGRAEEVTAALRRQLPRQASPQRLLANLEWLAARPEAAATLPAPVRQALAAIWRGLPLAGRLATAEGLVEAARASGLRLESRLATGSPEVVQATLEADWKAKLLRLRAALDRSPETPRPAPAAEADHAPLPSRHGALHALTPEAASLATVANLQQALGELARQVRESLARVTCNQLASLDTRDVAALPLLMEIPYRTAHGADVLRLRIDREAPAAGAPGAVWSIEFALDLDRHGPLRGRVTLAEGRVSITLQPERGALAHALDSRFDELRSMLVDAGVAIGRLTCTRCDPVDTDRTGAWLIDLRA